MNLGNEDTQTHTGETGDDTPKQKPKPETFSISFDSQNTELSLGVIKYII